MNQQIIITEGVEKLKSGVVASLQSFDRVATGKTIREMEVISSQDGAKLAAPYYIEDLETGRPGAHKPPQNRPYANIEDIKQWCAARGIEQSAAWAIKNKVDRIGFKGTTGVLSTPLSDQNVESVLDETMGKLAVLFGNELLGSIKT